MAEQQANAYTDWRFGKVNRQYRDLSDRINWVKRLNAGIAGVTVMASIPFVT